MKKGFTLVELLIGFFFIGVAILFFVIVIGQARLMNSFKCPPGSEETKGYVNGSYVHTCTTVAQ